MKIEHFQKNVHCSLFNCHLTSVPTRPIQECAQPAATTGMPQFPQSLGFDLADAFASDGKVLTDFFQSMFGSVLEAETHLDDALFARREGVQDLLGHFFQVDIDHGIGGWKKNPGFDGKSPMGIFLFSPWALPGKTAPSEPPKPPP